jgi:threonine dehydrogenase-like Zn-dependent dehydrogenase
MAGSFVSDVRSKLGLSPSQETAPTLVTIQPKEDKSRTMKAVEWHGSKDIRVNSHHPVPMITDSSDIVLKVTSSGICGSDLHLYLGSMPGMVSGDIIGHEFMGIVMEVGPNVTTLKPGDRVVTCFDIACGQCRFCKDRLFSCCNSTNSSMDMQTLYGARTAGFFGYSHLTGGYPGGQCEFVRVPFADINTLKIVDNTIPDEKVVLLSDILPTAWHGCELGEVHEGDNVAIWGAGPVGILAAHCALVRGAKEVVLIDEIEYRLTHAMVKLPSIHTINFSKEKVYDALRKFFPDGPDVGIDCVGMHYAHSLANKVQIAMKLQTDSPEIVNDIIYNVRKGGRVSLIGAYGGMINGFNLGAFMEKQQTMRGGQTPVQRYWKQLLQMILDGVLDPTMVITHQVSLDEAPEMYKTFNDKLDNCVKVVLHPGKVSASAAA